MLTEIKQANGVVVTTEELRAAVRRASSEGDSTFSYLVVEALLNKIDELQGTSPSQEKPARVAASERRLSFARSIIRRSRLILKRAHYRTNGAFELAYEGLTEQGNMLFILQRTDDTSDPRPASALLEFFEDFREELGLHAYAGATAGSDGIRYIYLPPSHEDRTGDL